MASRTSNKEVTVTTGWHAIIARNGRLGVRHSWYKSLKKLVEGDAWSTIYRAMRDAKGDDMY